jgi:hypothetical protein
VALFGYKNFIEFMGASTHISLCEAELNAKFGHLYLTTMLNIEQLQYC